jgi:hypothetical protein
MGPYAGVDYNYNLTLCPLQSQLPTHLPWATLCRVGLNPMPESTLSPSQELWICLCTRHSLILSLLPEWEAQIRRSLYFYLILSGFIGSPTPPSANTACLLFSASQVDAFAYISAGDKAVQSGAKWDKAGGRASSKDSNLGLLYMSCIFHATVG